MKARHVSAGSESENASSVAGDNVALEGTPGCSALLELLGNILVRNLSFRAVCKKDLKEWQPNLSCPN